VESRQRRDAVAVLLKLAASTNNPKLAVLANKAKLDPFAEVKLAIDEMVKELEQSKKDDITERDTCVQQMNQNQLDVQENEHIKSNVESKLEGLKATHDEQQSTIDSMKAEAADMKIQITRAGDDRQKAHREYQQVLKDQRETQMLLKKALAVLKAVYKSAAVPEMLLQQQTSKQAPPAGFKTFTTEKAGAGILAMVQQIISDA